MREVRKHLLVRIRRRHSAGQVTLAAPFVVIFMRWAAPHGWAVGRITTRITEATPRLFKNYNFRCTWTDGWTNLNNMLKLDEYEGGPSAPYGSRVILTKASESVTCGSRRVTLSLRYMCALSGRLGSGLGGPGLSRAVTVRDMYRRTLKFH